MVSKLRSISTSGQLKLMPTVSLRHNVTNVHNQSLIWWDYCSLLASGGYSDWETSSAGVDLRRMRRLNRRLLSDHHPPSCLPVNVAFFTLGFYDYYCCCLTVNKTFFYSFLLLKKWWDCYLTSLRGSVMHCSHGFLKMHLFLFMFLMFFYFYLKCSVVFIVFFVSCY